MRLVATGVGLAVLAAAASARAADPEGFGVTLGGRLAYALPMGSEHDGLSMTADGFSDALVAQLDALARVHPRLGLGLYGSYAHLDLDPAAIGGGGSDLQLTGHWWKAGVQLVWRAYQGEKSSAWLGYGLGLERVRIAASTTAGSSRGGLDGFEWVKVQGGVDFPVARAFTLGPFLDVSAGQYGKSYAGDASASIGPKVWHEWISLGLRGAYDL